MWVDGDALRAGGLDARPRVHRERGGRPSGRATAGTPETGARQTSQMLALSSTKVVHASQSWPRGSSLLAWGTSSRRRR